MPVHVDVRPACVDNQLPAALTMFFLSLVQRACADLQVVFTVLPNTADKIHYLVTRGRLQRQVP
jgi:hypothetical protein